MPYTEYPGNVSTSDMDGVQVRGLPRKNQERVGHCVPLVKIYAVFVGMHKVAF